MKYKAFKKITKLYEEIFTKEKETKELAIDLNKISIYIAEHQFGIPLEEPHVEICIKGICSYSMDLSTFIKKIMM